MHINAGCLLTQFPGSSRDNHIKEARNEEGQAPRWEALKLDTLKKEFVLNVDKSRLEDATGFDKDTWLNMADPTFGSALYRHYGFKPYWEDAA